MCLTELVLCGFRRTKDVFTQPSAVFTPRYKLDALSAVPEEKEEAVALPGARGHPPSSQG